MNQFIKMVLEAQGWDMGRKQAAEAPKCVHTVCTHTLDTCRNGVIKLVKSLKK